MDVHWPPSAETLAQQQKGKAGQAWAGVGGWGGVEQGSRKAEQGRWAHGQTSWEEWVRDRIQHLGRILTLVPGLVSSNWSHLELCQRYCWLSSKQPHSDSCTLLFTDHCHNLSHHFLHAEFFRGKNYYISTAL